MKKEIRNQYKQRMTRVGTRIIQSKAFEVGECKKGSRNLWQVGNEIVRRKKIGIQLTKKSSTVGNRNC